MESREVSDRFLAYRCRANLERRAAAELVQLGAAVLLPDDTTGKRRRITAPRYVFGDRAVSLAFAKHVRAPLPGRATLDEVMRLFCRPPPRPANDNPFKPGDRVVISRGPHAQLPAVVQEVRGRICIVTVRLFSKDHQQAMPCGNLRLDVTPSTT